MHINSSESYGWKDRLILVLLFSIIFTTTYAYIPDVYVDSSRYALFRYVNILTIGTLFILSYNSQLIFKRGFIRGFLFPTMAMLFLLTLFKFLGLKVDFAGILVIINAFMAMCVGHETKLGVKYLRTLLMFFALIAIVIGYGAVKFYLGDFTLESDLYLLDGKNQIGVIVSVAAFAMLYLFIMCNNKKMKVTTILLFLILFSLLILIRCRTALGALILATFIVLHKVLSGKHLALLYIVSIIFFFVLNESIMEIVRNVFIEDRNVADINELTTGRTDRNIDAIEYIPEHLIDGEMITPSYIELIHNYVLKNLVSYGIWCFPMLICYFMLIYKVFKQTILSKKTTLYDIGYYVLIIPLFCSLLEPGAPFGPGSVMLFMYILTGISLRHSTNK